MQPHYEFGSVPGSCQHAGTQSYVPCPYFLPMVPVQFHIPHTRCAAAMQVPLTMATFHGTHAYTTNIVSCRS